MAASTSDHYLPLIYTLGLKESGDEVSFYNDKAIEGAYYNVSGDWVD